MNDRRHIHSTLSPEQFKEVKRTLVDVELEMQEFIRQAVMEKCRRENEGNTTHTRKSSTS